MENLITNLTNAMENDIITATALTVAIRDFDGVKTSPITIYNGEGLTMKYDGGDIKGYYKHNNKTYHYCHNKNYKYPWVKEKDNKIRQVILTACKQAKQKDKNILKRFKIINLIKNNYKEVLDWALKTGLLKFDYLKSNEIKNKYSFLNNDSEEVSSKKQRTIDKGVTSANSSEPNISLSNNVMKNAHIIRKYLLDNRKEIIDLCYYEQMRYCLIIAHNIKNKVKNTKSQQKIESKQINTSNKDNSPGLIHFKPGFFCLDKNNIHKEIKLESLFKTLIDKGIKCGADYHTSKTAINSDIMVTEKLFIKLYNNSLLLNKGLVSNVDIQYSRPALWRDLIDKDNHRKYIFKKVEAIVDDSDEDEYIFD